MKKDFKISIKILLRRFKEENDQISKHLPQKFLTFTSRDIYNLGNSNSFGLIFYFICFLDIHLNRKLEHNYSIKGTSTKFLII